jgi:hypothetical protein
MGNEQFMSAAICRPLHARQVCCRILPGHGLESDRLLRCRRAGMPAKSDYGAFMMLPYRLLNDRRAGDAGILGVTGSCARTLQPVTAVRANRITAAEKAADLIIYFFVS